MKQKDLVLPRLYCPFPSQVSPFLEVVNEHTLAWARRFSLVQGERAFARLRDSKFPSLIARAYPRAPRERLAIISDWNTWLFLLDDECDEAGIGRRPDRLAALHARCLDVLSGFRPKSRPSLFRPRPGRPDVPLIHALLDLHSRMAALMSRAWIDHFATSVSEYFDAAVWEAHNREQGIWPDSETFGRIRPYTSAVYTFIDLIELSEGERLPLVARKHPDYQRLALMTNNVICWCNDLFSLAKERAHFDMHNLVLVLQHESGMSLQEAVEAVALLVEREVRHFVALEARLPSFGPTIDSLVQRFVAVLRAWMRGNLDWSLESGRYRVADEVTASAAL
jgi:5-epi-alpha-selinene synthase